MLWQRATIRYLCYGALFGAMFPIVATISDILVRGLPFSLASIAIVQSTQPLHWMIDSAPLFLGLFAGLAGIHLERLQQSHVLLTERNAALEIALSKAAHAEGMERLSEENARLYHEASHRADELEKLYLARELDTQTIHALGAPLIPINSDILAIPLIGNFDANRMIAVRATILAGAQARAARVVILDCTGIDQLTREAAFELGRTLDALGLLGARRMITGISPEIAFQFLASGAALQSAETALDLEGGIALALRNYHVTILPPLPYRREPVQ